MVYNITKDIIYKSLDFSKLYASKMEAVLIGKQMKFIGYQGNQNLLLIKL